MNNNNIHAKWELQRSTQFSNRTSVKEAGVQIFVIEHYRDDEDSRFYTEKSIASLPDIMRENEELKARCETYKRDYDSMVAEFIKLSGENSKMKEIIASIGRLENLANDLLKK